MVRLLLNSDNPVPDPGGSPGPASPVPVPGPGEIPVGVQQIADTVEKFMPMVEQMTGLNRRELSLQLLRSGLRGGNINSFLDALTGNKPAPEAKFIRYVKVLAIWVPVAVLLFGIACVSVILYAKLVMSLLTVI